MATAVQDVFNRAIALAVSNQGMVGTSANIIIARVNYGQTQLFTRLAQENRHFFVRSTTLASSNGSANRTLDLSTLVPPVERLLHGGLILPSGIAVNVVDFQDQNAELAPRGYPLGMVLQEVGSDWGATGAVTFTVVYGYRPADLTLNADLTQAITVPDRFASWLDYDLAIFFHQTDTARAQQDPQELVRLSALQEAVYNDLLQFVDHVMGPTVQRFQLPVPTKATKA